MSKPIEHTGREHAILSASGAHRWLNCTPSARLEEKSKLSSSSVYADEGTLAHEFGELNLQRFKGTISADVAGNELQRLRREKLYSDEMEGEVDKYVRYVIDAYQELKHTTPGAVLLIEEKFDFSHLVEKGFGTGDSTIIGDDLMEIIDLKYGKGIQISAEDNPQLKLYALGALRNFDMLYDIKRVKLTIIQPRLNSFSSWEISVKDLEFWGDKEVLPRAKEAYAGAGVQQAGEWCKFCKVKGMCATLAAVNVKLARYEFADPHLLKDEQILQVYNQIPMLLDWAEALKAHVLQEAISGKSWPGLKLVEGKANRKWLDEEKVKDILSLSHDEKDYLISKLAGIPAIEKLVGKKAFTENLRDLVIIPEGAPTLVPESDKRPAKGVASAKNDFSDFEKDDLTHE